MLNAVFFFCYNVSIPGFWEIWHSAVRVLNGNIFKWLPSRSGLRSNKKNKQKQTNLGLQQTACASQQIIIIVLSMFQVKLESEFFPPLTQMTIQAKNDLFPFAPFSVTTTPYQNVVFVHRKNHSKHCGVHVSRKVALQPLM